MKYKKLKILNNICTDADLACNILKKYIHRGLYMYESNRSEYYKIKDVERYKDYLDFRRIECNYGISSIYGIPIKHIIDGAIIFVVEKR